MSWTRDITLFCEGETLASTGPLPHGPSVHFSARSCAEKSNQPRGLDFIASLICAAAAVHEEARHAHPDKENAYRAPTDRSLS